MAVSCPTSTGGPPRVRDSSWTVSTGSLPKLPRNSGIHEGFTSSRQVVKPITSNTYGHRASSMMRRGTSARLRMAM